KQACGKSSQSKPLLSILTHVEFEIFGRFPTVLCRDDNSQVILAADGKQIFPIGPALAKLHTHLDQPGSFDERKVGGKEPAGRRRVETNVDETSFHRPTVAAGDQE